MLPRRRSWPWPSNCATAATIAPRAVSKTGCASSREGELRFGGNAPQFWQWDRIGARDDFLPVTSVATPTYPNAWLRLQRTGDRIWAYCSADAAAWTLLGETQAPRHNMNVGLIAASRDPSRFAEWGPLPSYSALARFRDFQIKGATNIPPGSNGLGITTLQDQPLSFDREFLLSPIRDPEFGFSNYGVSLYSVSSTSTNGALVQYDSTQPAYTFVYTPRSGDVGADEIQYVVRDYHAAISTVAVQVAVLSAGTVVNQRLVLSVTAAGVTFEFTGTRRRCISCNGPFSRPGRGKPSGPS